MMGLMMAPRILVVDTTRIRGILTWAGTERMMSIEGMMTMKQA